jgi:hypothetical protein
MTAASARRTLQVIPPFVQSRRRQESLFLGLGALSVVALLTLPGALAFAPLGPPYTAGCQGVATGTKIVLNTGTTGGGVYSYSNGNGRVVGSQWARSPVNGSHIQAGSYYFVGPGTSGCTRPTTTLTGLKAWWNWTVKVTPILMVNCSNNVSGASANYSIFTLGNIHSSASPFYVWSPHLKSVPLPFSHSISCSRTGRTVYSPGTLGPTNVSIQSPTFSLTAGSYDFYSSIYGDSATSYRGSASAYSALNISATLSQVSCPGCP